MPSNDNNRKEELGATQIAAPSQAPFGLMRDCVVVQLMDNFDQQDLDHLEDRILQQLCRSRHLRGVIFNLNEVQTTDLQDLQRLHALLKAIRLLGCRIGLCGINPGLAVVMACSGLSFRNEQIGAGIDELIDVL